MSDAKFLGLCIVFMGCMISATIVWSTKVNQALANQVPRDVTVPVEAPSSIATVKIEGPVTLAPLTAPIPVVFTNTVDNPVITKEASEKKWNRLGTP